MNVEEKKFIKNEMNMNCFSPIFLRYLGLKASRTINLGYILTKDKPLLVFQDVITEQIIICERLGMKKIIFSNKKEFEEEYGVENYE